MNAKAYVTMQVPVYIIKAGRLGVTLRIQDREYKIVQGDTLKLNLDADFKVEA